MPKGTLIGRGRTADVYAWEGEWVLKLYRPSFPRDWIGHEAEVGRLVRDSGLPAPSVREVVEVEGRLGFVCERVTGPSWLDQIKSQPWMSARVGRRLARLHFQVHASAAPLRARLRERVAGNVRDARRWLGDDADRVLLALEALPDGDAICHFDFHPDNVLGVGEQVRIIDWLTAGLGPPAMDVARTLLLIDTPYLPPGFPALLRPLVRILRRSIGSAYLAEYLRLSRLRRADVDAWRVPLAAARLCEEVPGEREWLLNTVRSGLVPPSTPLPAQREVM